MQVLFYRIIVTLVVVCTNEKTIHALVDFWSNFFKILNEWQIFIAIHMLWRLNIHTCKQFYVYNCALNSTYMYKYTTHYVSSRSILYVFLIFLTLPGTVCHLNEYFLPNLTQFITQMTKLITWTVSFDIYAFYICWWKRSR